MNGETVENGDKDRFYVLDKGEARPGRLRVPPVFASKARSTDTDDRLDGELLVEYADRIHGATAGQFLLLPQGVQHSLSPGSTPPPRVLQISSPGGWECFVEDLIEARPHITTGGKLDPRKLNPIAAKYDIAYEEAPLA
ncbi:cupin domain-containing protein [Actinomadura vinacea]|uniref:Cupin domain-containing protein n=1 Tax=Actinomadura vinacea TaxID=115336 RepID=A0ABN3IS16_9ACTN